MTWRAAAARAPRARLLMAPAGHPTEIVIQP
jgi:hypothetical protein